MLYIRCYKVIYLILITANLFLVTRRYGFFQELSDTWKFYFPNVPINLLAILANIISFILLEKGFPVAVIFEKVLSVIRMLGLLILACLIFSVFVIMLLPLGTVLWWPFAFELGHRIGYKHGLPIWFHYVVVLIVLALELLFFKKLPSNNKKGTVLGDVKVVIDKDGEYVRVKKRKSWWTWW